MGTSSPERKEDLPLYALIDVQLKDMTHSPVDGIASVMSMAVEPIQKSLAFLHIIGHVLEDIINFGQIGFIECIWSIQHTSTEVCCT